MDPNSLFPSSPSLLQQTPSTPLWYYGAYAVVVLVVLVFLVVIILKIKKRLSRPEMTGLTREQMAARWQDVRKTAAQGTMGAKLALLEADTLLDSGLKSISMPGETLGERLKVACYKYPKLQSVWWAHKLRNSLAHDSSFQLNPRQASQALDEFERALKVLNVM
ncbi:MAG: hypothetical protein WA001_00725 [Patescibacteria group bacterium]